MRYVRLRSDSGRDPLTSLRLQIGGGGLFLTVLRDVLVAFPRGMRIVLQLRPGFRSSDLRAVIEQWELDRDHRITIAQNDFASPFARDNAKAGRLAGEPVLVVPRSFRTRGDRAKDDLRRQFGSVFRGKRLVASRLAWEGGDVLSTSRHLILTAGTIRDNVRGLGLEPKDVRKAFETEFGQELLVLGDLRSPLEPDLHLDLSVAVLESDGGRVALVADPVSGAKLAATEGDRSLRRRVAGQYLPPAQAVGLAIRSWRDSAIRREPLLRGYSRQLRSAGYHVVRIPDLDVWHSESHLLGTPLSSYSTNVVLDGETKTAFSLGYGFRTVESAAASVFRRQGWRLQRINRSLPAAWELMRLGGGLHCMCGEWE